VSVVAREPPRPHPLLIPAIALIAGIALSDAVGPLAAPWRTAVVVLPACMLVALLLALWRRARHYVLLAFAATIALAAGIARHQQVYDRPPHHIAHALTDDPVLTRLAGRIVTTPIERPLLKRNPFLPFKPAPRTQFVLAVDELRVTDPPVPAMGQVRVSVEAVHLGLRLGQRVQATGRLWRPFGPRNPGEMDWSRWFQQQRIDAGLSVEGSAHVTPLPGEGSAWYGLIATLRSRAQSLLFEPHVDLEVDESTRLLDVMVLGQRTTANQQLNDAFLRAGGLHFLAVSGFNVAVLAGVAWLVVRRILRRGRRAAALTTFALTLLFALVTEPNAPILRATICVVVACLAEILERPFCGLNWLALSAACILLWNPNELFSPAFQLSFVQVLALITLVPALYRRCFGRRPPSLDPDDLRPRDADSLGELAGLRLGRGVGGLLLVTTCAYVVAQPLVLLHFQRFAPWGWFGSLLLTPLVTWITVLSLATMGASAVLPPLGALLHFLLQRSAELLLGSVRLFEHLPGAVVDCQPPPIGLVIATYGVLLLVVAARGAPPEAGPRPTARRPAPVRTLTLVKIGAAVLLVLAWVGWGVLPASPSTGPALHVLAAGNGNAILLTAPDGRAAVLDVGTDTNSDIGATAARALRTVGMRAVDAVLVSHGNVDHYSGLPTLLDSIAVKRWFTNPYFAAQRDPDSPLQKLLVRLPRPDMLPGSLHAGDELRVGDATLNVLWPPEGLAATWSVNDTSLVLRLTIGGHRVLLTGDADDPALAALLEAEREERITLNADVLIAPHHGKVIPGVTERFYAAVSPQVVIVSTRTPRPKLKALVENVLGPTARVLLTGEVGAVTMRVTPAGQLLVQTPCAPGAAR
jgi:competence protein ComEC